MLRTRSHLKLLAALLLSTAACTQQPAQIELKGQNSYSRDGANNYASNSYSSSGSSGYSYQPAPVYHNVSTATESSASVQSIGVSDLSPPTGGRSSWSAPHTTVSSPNAAPFKQATPEPKKADAGVPAGNTVIADDHINPWTKKPRETAASNALDESFNIRPQAKTKAVAKKEQMVSEVKIIPASQKKADSSLDNIVSNEGTASEVKKSAPSAVKLSKAEPSAGGSTFMWPVNNKKVISGFGPKGSGKVNDGINIASAEGEPVWAAADGEVVYVGNELQGYGNMVLIKHGGNKTTTYAHLSRFTVDKYDRVKQGDIIGYVGSSGSVKSPQLHFAIRDGKEPVDPMKQLNRSVASIH